MRRWEWQLRTSAFDAWYLSKNLADRIEGYGKGWVSRLKSNRIVHTEDGRAKVSDWERGVAREAFREIPVRDKSYWVYTQILDVNRLGRTRVVVCYDNKDLENPVFQVTNRLYWEQKKVVQCYSLRFRIDNFYKDAKQNLGLGGCHLRTLQGTRSHWLLGFLGYSLLKLRICRSKLYRRVKSDQTIGAECRQAFMDLLQNLIQWIYTMADKLPIHKILDTILR